MNNLKFNQPLITINNCNLNDGDKNQLNNSKNDHLNNDDKNQLNNFKNDKELNSDNQNLNNKNNEELNNDNKKLINKNINDKELNNKSTNQNEIKLINNELTSTNKQSWLLRLFESKLFNMSIAIVYLQKSKELGVLTYIGNKMFQFDDEEVNFYLPQIVVLYKNHNEIVEACRPYLLNRCKKDTKFTINLLWLLNSFCYDSKNCHPLDKKKCNGLKLKQLILSEDIYFTNGDLTLNSIKLNRSNGNKISELNCSKLIEIDKTNNQLLNIKKTHHRSYSETTQLQINKLQQHSTIITLKNSPSNQSLNNVLNQNLNHKIGDLNSGRAFDNNCQCLNTRDAVYNGLKGEKKFNCVCGAPKLLAQNSFIKSLISIGKSLQNLTSSRELKMQRLIADLQLFNLNLPARIYSPLHDQLNHLILRIPPEDSVLLNSKDKAPFLIYLEILKIEGDIDINSIQLPKKTNSLRLTRSEENLLNYHQLNSRSSNCLLNINTSTCKLDSLEYKQEITINASDIRKRLTNSIKTTKPNIDNLEMYSDDPSAFLLKEPFNEKKARLRKKSPFGHLQNWNLIGLIVKCDDLRQEMCAYQLLCQIKKIWELEKVPLYVKPYKIQVFSSEAGMVEPILSTISLHQIKKNTNNASLLDYFISEFGPLNSEGFLNAQKNFVRSTAAYSIISYLISLKDRHNNNILIDSEGHLIHIDYQFILSSSPGKNLGFENAAFKLTNDIIDVMGGLESDMWNYFKILILQGLLALRKNSEKLITLVEILQANTQLPCFKNAIKPFKDRFHLNLTENQLSSLIDQLCDHSVNSLTTKIYDTFQYYSNNIL